MTTAKEIVDKLRESGDVAAMAKQYGLSEVFETIAKEVESLIPKYRPPQPSDDGRYCYLEELSSDAPPTLVRHKRIVLHDQFAGTLEGDVWQFWTVAGWRELTKGVWPCERPEVGT